MLITILATVVVLGVLIFVHELGHFMAAKAVDIEVPRFSIGFGPRVFGFTRGETEYVISLLPLGGYVKMAGMEEMESIEGGAPKKASVTGAGTAVDLGIEVEQPREAGPRDFESKSLPARTLVISAGVLMNLLFAFLVFSVSAGIWGVQVSPESRIGAVTEELLPAGTEALAQIQPGERITRVGSDAVENFRDIGIALAKSGTGNVAFTFENHAPVTVRLQSNGARDSLTAAFVPAVSSPAVVGEVVRESAAARGGMKTGDRVVRADGQAVTSWQQFVSIVEGRPGQAMDIVVQRDNAEVPLSITPETRTLNNKLNYGRIGIAPLRAPEDALPRERPGFIGMFAAGAEKTWDIITLTAGFLWDLVSGGASPRNVGGPILIGQLSGQVARAGMEAFLAFMALFSVNLAVLNLLPIPVLDGGHLMFLLVEAVRGKALSIQQRMRWSQVGFVIVVAIMVWAVANDVLRLFGL